MNHLHVAASLLLIGALRLYGQGSSADFNQWSHSSNAVDAKGVRHDAHDYEGNPPWLVDRVSGPGPDYPREERRLRHEGRAIVRLTLSLKTGHVAKAFLLKSSGYPTLDRCAITAFSSWIWRPGKWKEIDLPVTFQMGNASQPPPNGSIRLTTMRALHTPRPQLPKIAYSKHLRGDGYFDMHVRPDGTVSRVDVVQSTGQKVLDDATVAALIKWRFEPGKTKKVRMPITYTGYYDKR